MGHRVESLLRRASDLHVATQGELAHVGDEEVVEGCPIAVERVETESRGVVETRSSYPHESAGGHGQW